MKRIKLTIAYDGTKYCGWQIQPNGITIEEVLNKVISKVAGVKTTVIGASRTDSGVHAYGNVAVFDTESRIPPDRFSHALNQKLPDDIYIVQSEEVAMEFHPRYCETEKTYEYHIINTKSPMPTDRFTNYFVSYSLDIKKMREGARYLVGTHDFVSFCSAHSGVENTIRTIYSLEIIERQDKPGAIDVRITGNGFLYNMVRIIIGTLVQVGRGFCEPEKVKEMLEAKCRTEVGVTAPAQGLFLVEIRYK